MFSDYENVRHTNCLIKPEPDYYKWFCQQVHGLGHEDTDDMDYPEFVIHDTWPLQESISEVSWRITTLLQTLRLAPGLQGEFYRFRIKNFYFIIFAV